MVRQVFDAQDAHVGFAAGGRNQLGLQDVSHGVHLGPVDRHVGRYGKVTVGGKAVQKDGNGVSLIRDSKGPQNGYRTFRRAALFGGCQAVESGRRRLTRDHVHVEPLEVNFVGLTQVTAQSGTLPAVGKDGDCWRVIVVVVHGGWWWWHCFFFFFVVIVLHQVAVELFLIVVVVVLGAAATQTFGCQALFL